MEGLNGSNDDRYFNESQFDEAKNVSRSTYFDHNVNRIALTFYTLGLLGNFITTLVISCRKDMHTPTFLAICSLAITDFIVIASTMTPLQHPVHLAEAETIRAGSSKEGPLTPMPNPHERHMLSHRWPVPCACSQCMMDSMRMSYGSMATKYPGATLPSPSSFRK